MISRAKKNLPGKFFDAEVAQMARAGVSYAPGRGFDSLFRHNLPEQCAVAHIRQLTGKLMVRIHYRAPK